MTQSVLEYLAVFKYCCPLSVFIFYNNYIIITGVSGTVYNGYSDNGYSDILDIVIPLSLSIFPHLHIRHTKCIG